MDENGRSSWLHRKGLTKVVYLFPLRCLERVAFLKQRRKGEIEMHGSTLSKVFGVLQFNEKILKTASRD